MKQNVSRYQLCIGTSLTTNVSIQCGQGLCAERDFKVVHGGFSDGSIHGLKHIPGTRYIIVAIDYVTYFSCRELSSSNCCFLLRCVVTNDGFNSNLQVWDLGGDDCGE